MVVAVQRMHRSTLAVAGVAAQLKVDLHGRGSPANNLGKTAAPI
jgi:hypothetical protein